MRRPRVESASRASGTSVNLLPWVLAIAPLVVFPGQVDFAMLPQQAFIQVFALLLVVPWLLRGPAGLPSREYRSFDVPIGVFLALSLLSLGGARDPAAGLRLATHWVCCALVYGLISRADETPTRARALLGGLFGGGVAVAALGLAQALAGLELIPQAVAPAGTLANRNLAAGYLVVVLPLGLVLWQTRSTTTRCLVGGGAAAILAFLPLTLCRSAAVALAVQVVCLSLLTRRRHPSASPSSAATGRPVLLGLAVAAALGLVGAVTALTLTDVPKARSVALRASLARSAVSMAREHPVQGVGLGNFTVHYPRHGEPIRPTPNAPPLSVEAPHNEALQVLAETGVPGLIAFLWVGWTATSAVVRLRRSRNGGTRRLAGALGLSLVGLGVEVSSGFPLRTSVGPLAAATILGLLAGLARGENEAVQNGRRSLGASGRGRVVRPLLASLVLATAATWSVGRLLSDRALYGLREAEASGRLAAAVRAAERAVRLDPSDVALKVALARAELHLGSLLSAGARLEEALERHPWDPVILGNLALVRLAGGDGPGAATLFALILETDPANQPARDGLARASSQSEEDFPETGVCSSEVDLRLHGDGRIDLVASHVPLADVLACLADQTGVELSYDSSPPRRSVSVALRNEPLANAVEGLLEGLGLDYALGFDPSGSRLEKVHIVGSEQAGGSRSGSPLPRRDSGDRGSPESGDSAPAPEDTETPTRGEPGSTSTPRPSGADAVQDVPDFAGPTPLSPTTLPPGVLPPLGPGRFRGVPGFPAPRALTATTR